MKKIDYHIHTRFSADSQENERECVKKAIEMGLDEICFTDHQDINYPNTSFDLNVDDYFKAMKQLQEEFKDQINIKIGVEIGLNRKYEKEINEFINRYPFDYVIGSIHAIGDEEFYEPALFFKDKTKQQAHLEFFKETLECVKTFDCFNCLGHLDYISRYGPYQNSLVDHQLYQEIIDEIFKVLIQKNKGIEINTSGFKLLKDNGFPNFKQVQRYYDLNGRIITIGTDSHEYNRVGENVEVVLSHLEKIGFKEISTFSQRRLDKEKVA